MITQQLITLLNDAEDADKQETPPGLTDAINKLENDVEERKAELQQAYDERLVPAQHLMTEIDTLLNGVRDKAKRVKLTDNAVSADAVESSDAGLIDHLRAIQTDMEAIVTAFDTTFEAYQEEEKRKQEELRAEEEQRRAEENAKREAEEREREIQRRQEEAEKAVLIQETRRKAWRIVWVAAIPPLMVFLIYLATDAISTWQDASRDPQWRVETFLLIPAILVPFVMVFLSESNRRMARWGYVLLGILPFLLVGYAIYSGIRSLELDAILSEINDGFYSLSQALAGDFYRFRRAEEVRLGTSIVAVVPAIIQIVMGITGYYLYIRSDAIKTIFGGASDSNRKSKTDEQQVPEKLSNLQLGLAILPVVGAIIWLFIDGIAWENAVAEYATLAALIFALVYVLFSDRLPGFLRSGRWLIYGLTGLILAGQMLYDIYSTFARYGIEWESYYSYSIGNPALFALFGILMIAVAIYYLAPGEKRPTRLKQLGAVGTIGIVAVIALGIYIFSVSSGIVSRDEPAVELDFSGDEPDRGYEEPVGEEATEEEPPDEG